MNRLIMLLVRWVVGGVFVFAGALKIFDPASFAVDAGNYRLLPHEWINLVAIVLPWIEFVAGIMLIIGVWIRASALTITVMMVVFLAAIGQALARGLDIRCGCFGTVEAGKVGVVELARDGVLLLMACWLVWRAKD